VGVCLAVGGAQLARAVTGPTASFTFSPTAPLAGQTVTFTNQSQPDPSRTTSTNEHLVYTWDFGDSSPQVTTGVDAAHAYTAAGVYTATLAADEFSYTDPVGSATTTAAITVTAPQVGPAPDGYSTGPNSPLTIDASHGLLLNDAPTATQRSPIHVVAANRVSTAKGGVVNLSSDGSFAYTPPADYLGDDTFTYQTADDPGVTSDPVTVTIGVLGVIAVDDGYTVSSGGSTTVLADRGVLANDRSDPDPTLTAVLGQTQPAHGSVALQSDGSFTYTPDDTGFTGQVSFSYVATGSTTGSDEGTVTLNVVAAPANDDALNAADVSGATGTARGSTAGATIEDAEPRPWDVDSSVVGQSVWYRWTAPSSGTVQFALTSSFASFLAAYPDPDGLPSASAELGASRQSISFDAVVDTTYLIQVAVDDDDPGAFSLSWSLGSTAPAGPPGNDNLADATSLSNAPSGAADGSNMGATTEDGEPTHLVQAGVDTSSTVWWTWVAPDSGAYEFDTSGSSNDGGPLDTTLGIFTQPAGAGLTEVVSNDDVSANDVTSRVEFTATQGATYLIQVGTHPDGPTGAIQLNWAPSQVSAAPANDNFASASAMDADSGSLDGSTVGATLEETEPGPPCDCNALGNTVWYEWTPSKTGTATLNLDSSFSGSLAVYQAGDSLSSLQLQTSGNGAAGFSVSLVGVGGSSYYVQVGTWDDSPGAFTLSWALGGPPPANDNWADAEALPGTSSGSVTGTNANATTEEVEPTALVEADISTYETVWWKWVAPASGPVAFDTNRTGAESGDADDTVLGVFTGASLSQLQEVASDDDDGAAGGLTARVRFDATAGTTYYVQVGSYYESTPGTFKLSWAPTVAPPNDDFAAAQRLQGNSGSLQGTTVDATLEDQEPDPFFNEAPPLDHTVWYSWTPSESGHATLASSGVGFDTALAVYRGASLGTLENVAAGHGSESDASVAFDVQAGQTYVVQVGTYVAQPGTFSLAWSLASTRRTIAGSVHAGDGSAAAGARVRACQGADCAEATSASDGSFQLTGLAPGVFVVSAYPADRSALATQTSVDVTDADATAVDLRFVATATGSTAAGPTSFTIAGCAGGRLHYVVSGDGATLGSGDVTDGSGSGRYAIDLSGLDVGHRGTLKLDLTFSCAQQPDEHSTAMLFADPSGSVVDDRAGGAALAGATVTLLDSAGNAIPAHDARLSAASGDNPETTDARGLWGWNVAPGTYRVRAEKAGCGAVTSGQLTVTPNNPATGVVLHLSCGNAPPPPPEEPTPPPVFPPPAPPTPPLPPPVVGVEVNGVPATGTVLLNGVPLVAGQQIPFGSVLDTTEGIVGITSIGPNGAQQTAYFFGGVFQVLQDPDGATELVLQQGDFSVCTPTGAAARKKTKRTTSAVGARPKKAAPTSSKKVVRAMWGTGTGNFRTRGRFSAATVRGTLWYTADRCDGTLVQVNQGLVTVNDLVRNLTLTVAAGHSVLVRPKNG
jgi:hypothetical protein